MNKKILNLKKDENKNILKINLPQGKTQLEIIKQVKDELKELGKKLYGKKLYLYGRITTGLALYFGHYLAHRCKEVWLFDPKENNFFLVIYH